jgi:pimeloyl-ACP methyl ester carboxylesterase
MRDRLPGVFDRSGRVRRPPYRRLVREFASWLFYWPRPPGAAGLPSGRSHVVLVVPAFLTTDHATQPLRSFLGRCGYRAFGARLGVNWGPTGPIRRRLRARLDALTELEGGPISLVGVSLGGLLARDLAHDRPQQVKRLITLVSPSRLPTASTIEPLFHLLAPWFDATADAARLRSPVAAPVTALFTREDGLVAWETCLAVEPEGRSIDVGGAHVTICRNPAALEAVAQILADSQAFQG